MLHKETIETGTFINFEEDIIMMQGKFDWETIAKRLNDMAADPKRCWKELKFS